MNKVYPYRSLITSEENGDIPQASTVVANNGVSSIRVIYNTGYHQESLFLDGVNDTLTITGSEDITNELSDGFTIVCVLNIQQTSGRFHILSKGRSLTEIGYIDKSFSLDYSIDTNSLILTLVDINGAITSHSLELMVNINKNSSLAVSYDPISNKINGYVDTNLLSEPISTITIQHSTLPLTIGSMGDMNSFTGSLSYFSFWKRVLSESEIHTIFSSENKNSGQLITRGELSYSSPYLLLYSPLRYTAGFNPANLALTNYSIRLQKSIINEPKVLPRLPVFNGRFRGTVKNTAFSLPRLSLLAWFRSDDESQYEIDSNGHVVKWYDNSINGNHAIPINSYYYSMPMIEKKSIGNMDAIHIPLRTDGMITQKNIGIESSDSSTFFIVVRTTSNTQQAFLEYGVQDSSVLYSVFLYYTNLLLSTNGNDYSMNIGTYNGGGTYILEVKKDIANYSLSFYNNGIPGAQRSFFSSAPENTPLRLGSSLISRFVTGDLYLAEYIVYNRVLSENEHLNITDYLTKKYAQALVDNPAPSSPNSEL